MRASARRLAVGGNAANTAQVLAGLGHRVGLLATVATDAEAQTLRTGLIAAGVDCGRLVRCRRGHTPLSYILLNAAHGTRTIVHHRDLDELAAEDFQALLLETYAWIHFEGRNVDRVGDMLRHLRAIGYSGRVSLEIEKPRPGLDALMPLADLLLLSRPYAEARWHRSAASLLDAMGARLPDAAMTCTWGGRWRLGTRRARSHPPRRGPGPVAGGGHRGGGRCLQCRHDPRPARRPGTPHGPAGGEPSRRSEGGRGGVKGVGRSAQSPRGRMT